MILVQYHELGKNISIGSQKTQFEQKSLNLLHCNCICKAQRSCWEKKGDNKQFLDQFHFVLRRPKIDAPI